MTHSAVQLNEWQTLELEPGSPLWGMELLEGRDAAEELRRRRQLEVLQLFRGVEVRATSWVGRIELGELTVTIRPKIAGAPFLHLLRYAYGLRRLSLKDQASYSLERRTFQDLIAGQLAAEIEELIARGLHRDYRREAAELAVPSGRIDFGRYVNAAGGGRASLPCAHHPRTRATNLNRVLLAGALLAARASDDVDLRGRLRRLGRALDFDEGLPKLSWAVIDEAQKSIDRRTRAYEPALNLISLLVDSFGISLDDGAKALRLSGFLFDMNRFFQALLSRFLGEHLDGFTVRDEHRLMGMFSFAKGGNPNARRVPVPRPDFVVLNGKKIASVLDAKYRDLWKLSLPTEMLYQLATYALSRDGSDRQAVILYPTLATDAIDQTIVLNEPVDGAEKARIVLRPVELLELEKLVTASPSIIKKKQCAALAKRVVFGRDVRSEDRRAEGLCW